MLIVTLEEKSVSRNKLEGQFLPGNICCLSNFPTANFQGAQAASLLNFFPELFSFPHFPFPSSNRRQKRHFFQVTKLCVVLPVYLSAKLGLRADPGDEGEFFLCGAPAAGFL